jgi:disulfide bond formation protein DsbB
MSTQTASLFFAILALLAWAGSVAVISLLVSAPRTRSGTIVGLREDVGRAAMGMAWVVAIVTTFGSLYYSEVAHFTPCKLCWYQRIAVYPLALLLGIATLRRDRSVRPYVIAQCSVGAVIAAYHSFIQAFPPEGGTSFCTVDAPCTARYVWELGFVSLPFMALSAFVLIAILMLAAAPAPAGEPIGDLDE